MKYGAYISDSGVSNGGVTIKNIRSVSLFLMTVVLFYMFVRFGFYYYQGNKLIASLNSFIGSRLDNQKNEELSKILRHVCKDNYLTQALVVMRQDEKESGLTKKGAYAAISKTLSVTILAIFVFFIGFFQYLTILYLTNTFLPLSLLAAALYLAYYLMFITGLIVDGENDTDSDGNLSKKRNFHPVFSGAFLLLIFFNIFMMAAGGIAGNKLKTQTIVLSHIPLKDIATAYSVLFPTLME